MRTCDLVQVYQKLKYNRGVLHGGFGGILKYSFLDSVYTINLENPPGYATMENYDEIIVEMIGDML
jgi:hypothetical protein